MIDFMLDTDISIYVIKKKPPEVLARFNQHYGTMAVSSVTVSELRYGYEKSKVERHRQEVEDFLNRIRVLDFDQHAAEITGIIRAKLANSGTPIGPYDVMIAGHAMAVGCIMVTNNLREFSRVDGLQVENWLDQASTGE